MERLAKIHLQTKRKVTKMTMAMVMEKARATVMVTAMVTAMEKVRATAMIARYPVMELAAVVIRNVMIKAKNAKTTGSNKVIPFFFLS